MIDWNLLHFIRPVCLLAFIPLLLGFIFLLRAAKDDSPWARICDPHLLKHLLVQTKTRTRLIGHWLYLALGIVLILALAGPTWEQSQQPVYQSAEAKVFVLDLSLSMKAEDIKPTRLARAKLKLLDMLALSKEGQAALIVFASAPFVVSPLTEDAGTIAAMIPTLDTNLMPAQGSRSERALEKAGDLLLQSNIPQGSIYLITDGVNEATLLAAEVLAQKGHRVSVLAVGTASGAPIPYVGGGFVNDANGGIVIPKTDLQMLSRLAEKGNGYFAAITADDQDVNYLLAGEEVDDVQEKTAGENRNVSLWQEKGPWLLLIALPLFALAFRRGWLVCVSLVLVMPMVKPAYALEWDDLWVTKNQQAQQLYQQGENKEAANLFEDSHWKAAAFYKSEDYQRALELYSAMDTIEGHYNKGNTLAKLGKISQAISEYEKVLAQDSAHEDAKYNMELLLKQEEQEQEKNQDQDQNQESKEKGQESEQQQSGDDKQSSGDEEQSETSENSSEEKGKSAEDKESDSAQKNSQAKDAQNKSQNSAKENAEKKNDAKSESPEQQATQQRVEQQQLSNKQYEERQQALEQWLRRIPDDPGGLLREKFQRQFQRGRTGNDAVVNEW